MVVVVPFVSWHTGSVPADIVIGVGSPTAGVILTVLVTCEEGPLQPFAVTCISTLPENPFAQVIIPVVGSIDPAELLNDQLKPVLFVAVVVYVVVVVPLVNWQVGSVPPDTAIGVGTPTVGVILTVLIVGGEEGPLQPFAVTRMSTLPEKPLAQVITPVDALMDPADPLLNDQLNPVLFVAVVA